MKLYVANLTSHAIDFTYRLPESKASKFQRIEVGTQQPIHSATLTQKEASAIIESYEKYGLKNVTDLDQAKPYVGLVYSMDKPVPHVKLLAGVEHNRDVLTVQGKRTRLEAAVHVGQTQLGRPGDNSGLEALEIELEEVRGAEANNVAGNDPLISETTRVDQLADSNRLTTGREAEGRIKGGRNKTRRRG